MTRFIKELSGYSGCHIHLYEDERGLFVRKLSGSESYNKRLEEQIKKQSAFSHPVLKAPKVFRIGYNAGCFYADMEYVAGKTVADMIRDHEYEDASKAIEDVLTLFTVEGDVQTNAEPLVKKLYSMCDALKGFSHEEICQRTLADLLKYTWTTYPAKCHGDLTLENMLVKDGTVYLIDFLDVFHECLEVDMAKLLQDIACGWSFRHTGLCTEASDFLKQCEGRINETYEALTNDKSQNLKAMLQLTLLRIYPYLKDTATKAFLDTQLTKML